MNNIPDSLGPLLVGPKPIGREATRRKKDYKHESVNKLLLQEYLDNGWELHAELSKTVQMKKPRKHDELIENQVWRAFYLMGYPELNSGRNFTIEIKRKGEPVARKQIDLFAKDDETVIIGECKSSVELKRKSLQKDIDEFANLKGPIAAAIRRQYGSEFRPKILWMFFTHNIIWSEQDKLRAESQNIHIVTERELPYYLQIADHLRHSARYQFLGEFLKDQKIPELEGNKVPAIRGKLAGRVFYSFIIKAADLLKIAFINHRSLNDPDGAPSYQRLVSRTRLKQVRAYIEKGGFFPNNLLINFNRRVRFEPVTKADENGIAYGSLLLPDQYRSAWVIDGQHRLYAYSGIPKKSKEASVIVVAFEGLPKEEEANLFVTINHEQKTVPKNLLDDLEGELKWGSEVPSERIGAIGARLVGMLNLDIGEPFHNRITKQGINPTDEVCLTIPNFKQALRRSCLIGKSQFNNKEFIPGPLSGVSDHATVSRAKLVINGYFNLIRTSNEKLWKVGRESVLCINTGVFAYLLLLEQLIRFAESENSFDARQLSAEELLDEITELMDPVLSWLGNTSQSEIELKFRVPYGSGGPPEYFFRLVGIINEKYSDFLPDGFEAWHNAQSEDKIMEADRQIKEINIMVQKRIFDVLKSEYGIEKDAYWEKGVKSTDIKVRAYQKSQEYDIEDRLDLEHYLDFIEYKKIVEHKDNWTLFKPFFDIAMPGDKGHAKNLKWMDKVNDLRRISAHATESRKYQIDDMDFLNWIYQELLNRLSSIPESVAK